MQYNAESQMVVGVAEDPIGDGLSVSISGGDGANNQYSPDEIDPISPAVPIFTYEQSGGMGSLSIPEFSSPEAGSFYAPGDPSHRWEGGIHRHLFLPDAGRSIHTDEKGSADPIAEARLKHRAKRARPSAGRRPLKRALLSQTGASSSGRLVGGSFRLEIFSPGGLVRGMTVQDLGTGKYAARNPTLSEAMREMGLIERFGTGIRIMRREMEALGSAPPIFVVDENSFTVTLPARELELWRNEGRRRYEMPNT